MNASETGAGAFEKQKATLPCEPMNASETGAGAFGKPKGCIHV